MTTGTEDKHDRVTALRIWLWKLRYAIRIYRRSRAPEDWIGSYFPWCLNECAKVGWEWMLDCANGNVDEALKEDPADAADDELSNWEPA